MSKYSLTLGLGTYVSSIFSSMLCGFLVPFLVYIWLVSAGYSKTVAAGIVLVLCVLSAVLNTVSGMVVRRRSGEKNGPA